MVLDKQPAQKREPKIGNEYILFTLRNCQLEILKEQILQPKLVSENIWKVAVAHKLLQGAKC